MHIYMSSRVEEQTHKDCLPSSTQIDLHLRKKAVLSSTLKEFLQKIQKSLIT
jgi:hypothetical protein